jgi:basic membrane lipoprotein Med (substrate-binding protein (PBP1-ABC) superfamily)
MSRRLRWVLLCAAGVLAAGGQYLDVNACLLTDDQGVAGSAATPVWAGMQDASVASRVRVQFLPVSGAQTTDNALTFLASLAQSRCGLVFAAGDLPVAAVIQGAQRFPGVRFVVVGHRTGAANVSTVDASGPAEIRSAVRGLVAALAPASPGTG